jgi:hypothetical protein
MTYKIVRFLSNKIHKNTIIYSCYLCILLRNKIISKYYNRCNDSQRLQYQGLFKKKINNNDNVIISYKYFKINSFMIKVVMKIIHSFIITNKYTNIMNYCDQSGD